MRIFSVLLLALSSLAAHAHDIEVSTLKVGASGDLYTLAYANVACTNPESGQIVFNQYGLIGPHQVRGVIATMARLTYSSPELAPSVDPQKTVSFVSDELNKEFSANCRVDMSALDAVTAVIMDSQKAMSSL